MLRCGVSIIVLIGYLAGLVAIVPHAHAGAARHAQDGWQPHIHLSKSECDEHGHHHGGHSHADDHAHDHSRTKCNHQHGDSGEVGGLLNAGGDHDADAVYFAAVEQIAPRNDQSGGLDLYDIAHQSLLVSALPEISVQAPPNASALYHSADASVPRCALYVTLRSLRI